MLRWGERAISMVFLEASGFALLERSISRYSHELWFSDANQSSLALGPFVSHVELKEE